MLRNIDRIKEDQAICTAEIVDWKELLITHGWLESVGPHITLSGTTTTRYNVCRWLDEGTGGRFSFEGACRLQYDRMQPKEG